MDGDVVAEKPMIGGLPMKSSQKGSPLSADRVHSAASTARRCPAAEYARISRSAVSSGTFR